MHAESNGNGAANSNQSSPSKIPRANKPDTPNGEEANTDFIEPIPPTTGELLKNNSIKIGSLAEEPKDINPGENDKSSKI